MAGLQSSDDIFDFQGYLEWQEEEAKERGSTNDFIQELAKTQCFHEFIEQRQKDQAESNAVFFESCIELLQESDFSLRKLKSAQQDMID